MTGQELEEILNSLNKTRDIGNKQLAKKLGVSLKALNLIFKSEVIDTAFLKSVADFFGLTVEDIDQYKNNLDPVISKEASRPVYGMHFRDIRDELIESQRQNIQLWEKIVQLQDYIIELKGKKN